eukprot:gene2839-3529_t
MSYNRGKVLKKGSTIGIVALASPVTLERAEKAQKAVTDLGFNVVMGKTCYMTLGGYLAGSAEIRAREMEQFFQDPNIDCILNIRGGYGTPQILDLLDYDLISRHPKLFIGYSDITALHIVLQQKCNMATLHGPMAGVEMIDNKWQPISKFYYMKLLLVDRPLGYLQNSLLNPPPKTLVHGRAYGCVTGGNLSLVVATLGSSYEIDTKGKILFLEDVDEEPYRIDRMLTQLHLAGKFKDCIGVILGSWTGCVSKDPNSFTVDDLFQRIIVPYGKPTLSGMDIGHDPYEKYFFNGVFSKETLTVQNPSDVSGTASMVIERVGGAYTIGYTLSLSNVDVTQIQTIRLKGPAAPGTDGSSTLDIIFGIPESQILEGSVQVGIRSQNQILLSSILPDVSKENPESLYIVIYKLNTTDPISRAQMIFDHKDGGSPTIPTNQPTEYPVTPNPSSSPTPSENPSTAPSENPSETPSANPSQAPSEAPSTAPSEAPSEAPSTAPSEAPSVAPSENPSTNPIETEKPPTPGDSSNSASGRTILLNSSIVVLVISIGLLL